jgi:hypothetical protein
MKSNRFVLLALLLTFPIVTFGQVRFGIRGGINTSRLKSDDVIVTPNPTSASNYRITIPKYAMIGYHAGLIGQIQLFNFYIQPEALYTVTRNDIHVYDLNSADPDNANQITQTLNRLDFPLMLGLKAGAFKAGIGPVLTFLISDDSDLKSITDYDLRWNKATVGFQAGIGFDIKKLAIDLKYEGNLSKIGNGISLGEEGTMNFNSRIQQVILSVGLFF